MGLWERRQHRHYIDALETIKVFSRTPSFEAPEILEHPELTWHQGDERRNWQDYKAFLGGMTVRGTMQQSNVNVIVKQPQPAVIIELPQQPGPPAEELIQEEMAV